MQNTITDEVREKLWAMAWRAPKKRREEICTSRGHHMKDWFGITTVHQDGTGFCALCACTMPIKAIIELVDGLLDYEGKDWKGNQVKGVLEIKNITMDEVRKISDWVKNVVPGCSYQIKESDGTVQRMVLIRPNGIPEVVEANIKTEARAEFEQEFYPKPARSHLGK